MTKRGPTDTDGRATPPADSDVEVVNAAGERKVASLLQRGKAKVRDTLSMTDEQRDAIPTWGPGELDEHLCPEGGTTMQCSLPKGHSGPHDYRPRPELADDADDRTLVTGNTAIQAATDDQEPPAKVMRELGKRRAHDVEQRVGMAAAKVAGLVELDRWNRLYAIHIHHLASIAGLQAVAVEALQDRNLPTAELRGLFRAELDEWERDIESGGSG
jgi:hypothetical protein